MPANSFRQPTASPTTIGGTSVYSGQPNTGQLRQTYGGQVNIPGLLSGGGAAAIALGQGRLDTAQILSVGAAVPQAASGQQVIFYDSHAVGTGYVPASGHKILAILDPRAQAQGMAAFNSGALMVAGLPIQLGVPYNSGLNVVALSGAPGYTCSYTPVLSGQG